ncbi:FAD:protein FMN transferase [Actinocrispum wychmicini]|uniref:FAD:protein FMN transferase n=1 Tax=Actinocrispum wychmicini TaxID=1213861 RepID=A0A4V2S5V3_9PSEU|nr:FAD:protein FMN transferase [Actinocrispum wychmicini]TCO53660.1 thiamine biosynthesis lipoprotein [Actinocrispum wychmicini]
MTTGVRFTAIGTTVHLLITAKDALPSAEWMLREFIADLDKACSRFRDDSALSELNRTGTSDDPILVAALQVALQAAADTDGLVDPTLGGYMVTLGYDQTFANVAPYAPEPVFVPSRPRQAWRDIEITPKSVTVPHGVRIDLGATAKAWAADTAAKHIADETGAGVLVNLGGDVSVAGPAPEGGWNVRVTADHTSDDGGQVVCVRSGGLATSSVTVRSWQRGDQELHHVLDPSTGLPAPRIWRYATVSAVSCVAANTASTAALVLGEGAPHWLAARKLPARLVATSGAVTTVSDWPGEGS